MYSKKILRSSNLSLGGKINLNSFERIGDLKLNDIESLIKEKEELEREIIYLRKKYDEVIDKTSKDSEKILEDAKLSSINIEKTAYEKGYEDGKQNGYEDGYKESYEEHIESAKECSEKILDDCKREMLLYNEAFSKYLEKNKNNIIEISINIAEKVLMKKFDDVNAMNDIIENIIVEYKLKKTLIVRVNPIYIESLSKNISNIDADIVFISDEKVDVGNAIIEKDTGSLFIGIDAVLSKIKEELL